VQLQRTQVDQIAAVHIGVYCVSVSLGISEAAETVTPERFCPCVTLKQVRVKQWQAKESCCALVCLVYSQAESTKGPVW
jgi:hypothetical protein